MPRKFAALALFLALSAFSSSAEAFSQKLWKICSSGDDMEASIKACTQMLADKETDKIKSQIFYNRAWAYRQKGDYDSAIADDTRSIELDPKSPNGFIDRGNAYFQKGEYDLSIADSTRGMELSPKAEAPYINRGAAYRKKGDYDRAFADFDRALELNPKSDDALYNRGTTYNERGDYAHAIADLTRAIALKPKVTDARRHRAVAYIKTGKFDLARADLDKALELKPDNPEARATLAELGQAEAAAKGAVAPAQQAATEPVAPVVETPAPAAPPVAPSALPPSKRVALVIGNSAYTHTAALGNPDNDAADVAAALRRLGFTVIFEHDLDKRGMDDTFRRFAREVKGADVALFYYAGHAMQFEGVNYLMPVDAKLADEADVPYEMAKLDDVVADMARMSGVRIAVLDACRNNPLEEQLKRSVASTRGVAQTRGLARIARPEGLIVAYATQSGNVAEDGSGRNSPFTAALLQHIETPGLEVGTLFRRVMGSVKQATSGKQHPELSVLFDGEFYFKPGS